MTQFVSPLLLQWIRDQSRAGYSRDDLLKSVLSKGWDEAPALEALSTVFDVEKPRKKKASTQGEIPARLKVPQLKLEGAPLYLDAGDRRVAVLGVVKDPCIVMLGGLLSDEECDALIDAARPAMKRSSVLNMESGDIQVQDVRTSNGMSFQRSQNEVVERVEARLARLANWPVENGEGLQVLQYGPGAEYKPHYDYFDPREPGTATILKRGGQRVATILMYLSEPERGGGTLFPNIGLEVGPRRGNGVFFSYDVPHPSSRTKHGGSPVKEGEKWIATKWLRENKF